MSKITKKPRIFKDGNQWCCVGRKFVNIQESASGFGDTPEEAHTDYLADVAAMKAAKKLVKAAKKLKSSHKKTDAVGNRNNTITEHAKVCFIGGQTPSQVRKSAKAFNLTLDEPLKDVEVKNIVATVQKMKSWLKEVPTPPKMDTTKREEKLNRRIVKGFANGTNRNGVISLALIKNNKFKNPLPDGEVIDLVRVEWERLNPPSK